MIVRLPGRLLAAAFPIVVVAGCALETSLSLPPSFSVSNTAVTIATNVGGGASSENITIVNATDGTLQGLAAVVSYAEGQPGNWLTATIDRPTATRDQPATLTLQATPGSLAEGGYQAIVKLSAQNARNDNGIGFVEITVTLQVQPPPASSIAIVTQPSGQVGNGSLLAQQPVLQLRNSAGANAPVAGVVITAAVTEAGSQLQGTLAVATDAQGVARFTDLGLLGTIGTYTLTFSSPNLTTATTGPVTLTAGPATAVEAVSSVLQAAAVGTLVAEPPSVRVIDQSGNPVSGFAVSFGVSAGGSITPTGTLTSAGQTGLATLTSWRLSPTAGANTVTASATGLQGSPVVFTASGTSGAATVLTKQSGDNLTGLVGTTLATPHVVRVADGNGNGVAGVTINWTVTGGGTVSPSTSVTDIDGLASATRTLGPTAGPATTIASATLNGIPVSTTFAVTGVTSAPTDIVKIAGDAQTGGIGATLPTPLTVEVRDANGAPVSNITVTFTTTTPGGSFPSGAVVQTDAAGQASATWRLGNQVGTQTAQAAVGGPAPAVFTATAEAGSVSATLSTVAAAPITITAGGAPAVITVTAKDAAGNPVSGAAVTLAVAGPGTLTQPTSPTDATGQTTGQLTSTVSGSAVVTATASGVDIAQSSTIMIQAGAPTKAVATSALTQPARFGQPVSDLPGVLVTDQYDNPVPNVSVSFFVTQGSSAALPSQIKTNANGVARVGAWVLDPYSSQVQSAINVYNRLTATVAGAGITGGTMTFLALVNVFHDADLQEIWNDKCISCHDNTQQPDLRAGHNAYATLVGAANQLYVVPGDSVTRTANKNKLLYWPSGLNGAGHSGGSMANNLLTIVAAWIAQGAPRN